MDRGFGWLASIGVHLALLLGLTLVVVERYVHASGSNDLGMRCTITERSLGIDRIDRTPDHFGSWVAKPDPPPFVDDFSGGRSPLAFISSWGSCRLPDACPCWGDDGCGFLRPLPLLKFDTIGSRMRDPDRYRLFNCRCKATFCRLGTHCPICHGRY